MYTDIKDTYKRHWKNRFFFPVIYKVKNICLPVQNLFMCLPQRCDDGMCVEVGAARPPAQRARQVVAGAHRQNAHRRLEPLYKSESPCVL